MNRYSRGPTIGGPSKATASTLLEANYVSRHYSYECKAVSQDRPYVSRPSRTQQLLNPKLVPKLTSDVPQDLLRKKGIADEQLAKAEQERGRKRERQGEESEQTGTSKRVRSGSASSVSVSTISTDLSRSPSPQQNSRPKSPSLSRSPPRKRLNRRDRRTSSLSPSPTLPSKAPDSDKKRRRASYSSEGSYNSDGGVATMRDSRGRGNSRSTRRRFQHLSPPARGRGHHSRSPHRGRRGEEVGYDSVQGGYRNESPPARDDTRTNAASTRERSLSPFSKRLALTQAMNTDR